MLILSGQECWTRISFLQCRSPWMISSDSHASRATRLVQIKSQSRLISVSVGNERYITTNSNITSIGCYPDKTLGSTPFRIWRNLLTGSFPACYNYLDSCWLNCIPILMNFESSLFLLVRINFSHLWTSWQLCTSRTCLIFYHHFSASLLLTERKMNR